jgi:hypothetical protein
LSISEVIALIDGSLTSQTDVLTPYWIKVLKDLIFLMIILIGIIHECRIKSKYKIPVIFFSITFLFIFLSSFILSLDNPVLVLFSGIRWLIPFFIPFLACHLVDQNLINSIKKPLLFAFIIHLSVQIIQLFSGYSWYGINLYGLSARSPGVFLIPGTGAVFSVFCLYMAHFLYKIEKSALILFTILCLLSVLLTSSKLGVLAFSAIISLSLLKKINCFFSSIISIITSYIAIMVFTHINDRGLETLNVSGGTRVNIFTNHWTNSNLLSSDFGYGSNTAYLISDGMPTDSTYSAILVNFGMSGLFFFIVLVFFALLYSSVNNLRPLFGLIMLVVIFSLSTNLTETYPVSLLIGLISAFYVGKRTENKNDILNHNDFVNHE